MSNSLNTNTYLPAFEPVSNPAAPSVPRAEVGLPVVADLIANPVPQAPTLPSFQSLFRSTISQPILTQSVSISSMLQSAPTSPDLMETDPEDLALEPDADANFAHFQRMGIPEVSLRRSISTRVAKATPITPSRSRSVTVSSQIQSGTPSIVRADEHLTEEELKFYEQKSARMSAAMRARWASGSMVGAIQKRKATYDARRVERMAEKKAEKEAKILAQAIKKRRVPHQSPSPSPAPAAPKAPVSIQKCFHCPALFLSAQDLVDHVRATHYR